MKPERQAQRTAPFRRMERALALVASLLLAVAPARAGSIAQSPLFAGFSTPPNIILAVDDSASMQSEVAIPSMGDFYTVDASNKWELASLFPDGNVGGYVPPIPWYADARSPDTNKVYFNPAETYEAWTNFDNTNGLSFSAYTPDNANAVKWSPAAPNPTTWKPPACDPSLPVPGGFPNIWNLTQDIQCTELFSSYISWGRYAFGIRTSISLPKGTVFTIFANGDSSKPIANCSPRPGDSPHVKDLGNTWYEVNDNAGYTCTLTWGSPVPVIQSMGIKYFPATFYLRHGTDSPYPSYSLPAKDSNLLAHDGNYYDRYEIRPENFGDNNEYRTAIANFANWFAYARKRQTAVQGAIGRVFNATDGVSNIYLGIFRINEFIHSATPPKTSIVMGDLTKATDRNALMAGGTITNSGGTTRAVTGLYQFNFTGGTPNLRAVYGMGNLFQASGTVQYACQKNAGILFTDGSTDRSNYLPTSTDAGGFDLAIGNVDGGKGAPYADSVANTMADVAMQYYTKLNTGFPDGQVPIPDDCGVAGHKASLDCNKDLHMNFYAVTLGQAGRLYDPLNPDPNDRAYTSAPAWAGAISSYSADASDGSKNRIDDLWHATINGRGDMLAAQKPTDVRTKITEIINRVLAKDAFGSSGASSSSTTSTGDGSSVAFFQASFNSDNWHGDLEAYPMENGAINLKGTPYWSAAANLPDYTIRHIYTYNGGGVEFSWSNLSGTQKTALNYNADTSSADGLGEGRVSFLKGNTANEQRNGGTFRSRVDSDKVARPLGDIIGSAPAYTSAEDLGYGVLADGGGSYAEYKTKGLRTPMVYVGAGDGMLHAFNASLTGTNAGKELFAYVPAGVYSNLSLLTAPRYAIRADLHRYFVDGSPKVGDAYWGGSWKTLVVGTTGAGGKSIFALDVTAPGSFDATKVLWEVTDSATSNLGYTIPQPNLVKTYSSAHPWVVIAGNGYNSAGGKAVLLVIDAKTGDVVKEIDTKATVDPSASPAGPVTTNGLSTPFAADIDQDRIPDYVYAGDLLGNVWKFDIRDSNADNWKVAFGTLSSPEPLFIACASHSGTTMECSAANRQPITAKPQAASLDVLQGGLMVFVGTGKFFESGDNVISDPAQVQTFYGLWDKDTGTSSDQISENKLQAQTIDSQTTASGRSVRITSANAVDYATQSGWYLDLKYTGESGERVTSNPLYHDGRIAFTSFLPSGTACAQGGKGWLMELDALNGGYYGKQFNPIFDLDNEDGLDSKDLVLYNGDTVTPSGVGFDKGIPFGTTMVSDASGNYMTNCASDGTCSTIKTPLEPGKNSRSSWRQIR